jgi:hypothetical protein
LGHWVAPILKLWLLPAGPGLILLALAYFVYYRRDFARRHPEIFLLLPRWCAQLREYTTREERRRIAYYWLNLPLRTQVQFNSNDRAFLIWADMIVMATVTPMAAE